MKKYILLLSALLGFGSINAQQTKILSAEKHNEYGLVYTLPLTSFEIEVTAVKEVALAGPYSNYAKVFLSNSSAISKDEVKWSIESVKVRSFGIPDPDNRYLMQLKAGSVTYIGVADDGMLLTINQEPKLPSPEAKTANSVIGIPSNGKEYLEFVNEDFLSAQSKYKQAQLLAEELMEIRDAKLSLTRGTAETMPTDGRQLEIMLESLGKQESALTNAFIGNVWKEKYVESFTVTPSKEGKYIICRLNSSEGLVDSDDLSGDPLYLNVNIIEQPKIPVDSKGEEKKLPKDAVVYCIPGETSISVSYKNESLFENDFPMSQFGMTFGLNPSIFSDKKEPAFAVFDPATGALKELGTLKQ